MNHLQECKHEREFVQIRDDFKVAREDCKLISETAKSHVTWTIFWSIILLLVGIGGSAISNNYAYIKDIDSSHQEKMKDLEERTRENELIRTKIETQLSAIQTQLADINLKLAKIK